MSWKEFLLNLGISTLTGAIAALINTAGIGPNFKAACLAADQALAALATAAETPDQ
jgi:hypothetical protein